MAYMKTCSCGERWNPAVWSQCVCGRDRDGQMSTRRTIGQKMAKCNRCGETWNFCLWDRCPCGSNDYH